MQRLNRELNHDDVGEKSSDLYVVRKNFQCQKVVKTESKDRGNSYGQDEEEQCYMPEGKTKKIRQQVQQWGMPGIQHKFTMLMKKIK